MLVRNFLGKTLSISIVTQKFIKIFHSVQEIEPFSLFFRIWRSAKPRPMINVILQFLGLDLFNIKLSAKFYQHIPNGLRVNFHFCKNLYLGKTSTNSKCYGLHHVNIPTCMHNFITIFHSVQELGPFSLFQNMELGKTSTDERWHITTSWARSW